MGGHPKAHGGRRSDPRADRVAARGSSDRALEPRTLGRPRLPRRARRGGDPAWRAHRLRLRRVPRDGGAAPLPAGPPGRARAAGADGERGHAVRPGLRRRAPRGARPPRIGRRAPPAPPGRLGAAHGTDAPDGRACPRVLLTEPVDPLDVWPTPLVRPRTL